MTVQLVQDDIHQPLAEIADFAVVAAPDAMRRAAQILDQDDARELMGQASADVSVAWDTFRTRLLGAQTTRRDHPGLEQLVMRLATMPRGATVRIRNITSNAGLLSLVWDQAGAPVGLVTPHGDAARAA